MTARELITELQKWPPEMVVTIEDSEGAFANDWNIGHLELTDSPDRRLPTKRLMLCAKDDGI